MRQKLVDLVKGLGRRRLLNWWFAVVMHFLVRKTQLGVTEFNSRELIPGKSMKAKHLLCRKGTELGVLGIWKIWERGKWERVINCVDAKVKFSERERGVSFFGRSRDGGVSSLGH